MRKVSYESWFYLIASKEVKTLHQTLTQVIARDNPRRSSPVGGLDIVLVAGQPNFFGAVMESKENLGLA